MIGDLRSVLVGTGLTRVLYTELHYSISMEVRVWGVYFRKFVSPAEALGNGKGLALWEFFYVILMFSYQVLILNLI